MLEAAAQNRSVAVFGADYPTPDGTCVRDYIHVSDLARAHAMALDALGGGLRSGIFNLGSGHGYSVQQVIDTAQRVTGRSIKVELQPRRAGDPAVLVASSAKIRRQLGWMPGYTSLDDIVGSAWSWMQRQAGESGDATGARYSEQPHAH